MSDNINIPATSDRLGDRIEAMEKEARAWALMTKKRMLFRLVQLGVTDYSKITKSAQKIRYSRSKSGKLSVGKEDYLYKSLSYKIRKRDGEMESIAFVMARHGIFLERGVGRGRPQGSGSAESAKKEWIKPVLDPAINDLADILAEKYADIVAGELAINIPGIMSTKIKVG